MLDDRKPEGSALGEEADATTDRRRGGEGRVHAHRGREVDHAHAVRSDKAHPGLTTDGQQLTLPGDALPADLGEPGRDHDDGLDALLRAGPRDVHRRRGGDHEHREVHRARDVTDRAVGRDRLDDIGIRVHGVDRAGEAPAQQVVEELAADGPAAARGPDHGHRGGVEEAPHGGGSRALLAPFEPISSRSRQRRRELDEDRARLGAQARREAALVEDPEHPGVLGEDIRAERGDARFLRPLGQLLEQQRRDAAALGVVGHDERDLGQVGSDAVVAGVRDDPVGDARLGDERAVARLRRRRPAMRQAVEVAHHAGEAHPARFGRESPQEGHERGLVLRPRLANPDRRPVPEDGVARAVP